MQTILEYIMLNYIWIIVGSIIILLAVIGYYADKTNFGQGKTIETENDNIIDIASLHGKRMEDLFEHNGDVSNKLSLNPENTNASINLTPSNNINTSQNIENMNFENMNSQIDSLNQSEENFEKFDKEFNELLPKKEIIDGDLLDEVNNLSFDKTQKIQISDILNVDDVELPEIKTLPIEEEDIWKF